MASPASLITSPLLITMGDPCGIGPEIILKAWEALYERSDLAFGVIGCAKTLKACASEMGLGQVQIIAHSDEVPLVFGSALPVLDRPLSHKAIAGQPDPRHGVHIIEWIKEAVALCLDEEARALITAPIAKSVLYEAGFEFPGHTEFLEHLTQDFAQTLEPGQAHRAVMMLTAPDPLDDDHPLRVVLATIHIPLEAVANHLDAESLKSILRITHRALRVQFGIEEPRLVLAGLNPHAGEQGTIGRQEIELLAPLVAQLSTEMNLLGPLAADSLFHAKARSNYDAVICLYHDQGLIPLKMLDFWRGVNISLGLPIVRTSPDHGTGFDLAGQNKASALSLIEAIKTAHALSLKAQ